MIPLMVQQDYKPQGWLGLILGTRMWYSMWDAEQDDDTAFERRLDSVVREIGDRGKLLTVSEAVPPFHEPTPAPAPAPAPVAKRASVPAPAPAREHAPVRMTPPPRSMTTAVEAPAPAPVAAVAPAFVPSTPAQAFTPMVHQQQMMPSVSPSPPASEGAGMGGSLTEVAMFMEKQQRMQMERDAQARAEKAELEAKFEAQRQQLEAKYEAQLEKQRQAMEAQLEQRLSEAKPQAAADAIVDEQLEAFQERLQSLLTAKLLTQDELAAVEDIVADCIEVCPTASVEAECVDTTLRMLRLSEKMKVDGSFARQLRRKYAK
jgi:hypothetical protein